MKSAASDLGTIAVLVGIDRYRDERWTLDSPAADAVRWAKWLLDAGHARPDDIWLFAHSNDELTEELELLDSQGVGRIEPTDRAIADKLWDLRNRRADLLFLYWSGHGEVNEKDHRVLYLPEAYADRTLVYALPNMLDFLKRLPGNPLSHQIILIDSCANFFAHRPGVDTRLAVVELGGGDTQNVVNQEAYYSAARGEPTTENAVTRSSHYTEAVLKWLDSEEGSWPPNRADLRSYLEQRGEALGEYFWSSSMVDDKGSGPIPASRETLAAARRGHVSPSQLLRLAEYAGKLKPLTEPEDRDRLRALMQTHNVEVEPHATARDELFEFLQRAMEIGMDQQLLAAVESLVPKDSDRTELLGLRLMLKRMEAVAPFAAHFRPAAVDHGAAFRYTSGNGLARAPRTIEEALEFFADFRNGSKFAEFVLRMEAAADRPLTAELVASLEGPPFAVPPHETAELRAAISAGLRVGPDYLLLDLGIGDQWPSSVKAHLRSRHAVWEIPKLFDTPRRTRSEVRAAVDEAIKWALGSPDAGLPVVGIAVAPTLALQILACLEADGMDIVAYYPVVLRHAPRLRGQSSPGWSTEIWEVWGRQIQERTQNDRIPTALWLPRSDAPYPDLDAPGVEGDVQRSRDCELVGFRTVPPQGALLAALRAGAPFIVWPNDTPKNVRLMIEVVTQALGGPGVGALDGFPARLRSLSHQAGFVQASDRVRAYWDDVSARPPAHTATAPVQQR